MEPTSPPFPPQDGTRLWAHVSRRGRAWPIPIDSRRSDSDQLNVYHEHWSIIDELFTEDRVSFRECPQSRQVVLDLRLFPTSSADDGIGARLTPDTVGVLVLGRVACEGCGFVAIHDVLLSDIPRSIDLGWFVVRQCVRCGCPWAQPVA